MSFGLKLLSGKCKGSLNRYIPIIYTPSNSTARVSRHTLSGLHVQIKPNSDPTSLKLYANGFLGTFHNIWSRIPQNIIINGSIKGWLKIKKICFKFLAKA